MNLNHPFSMRQFLYRQLRRLHSPECVLCQQSTQSELSLICQPCINDLAWNTHYCCLCAEPVQRHQHQQVCAQCSSVRPALDSCHTALLYQLPSDELIKQLKYKQKLHYAELLALCISHMQLLQQCLVISPAAKILPVPIHPQRLRQRGYNQAELICEALIQHSAQSNTIGHAALIPCRTVKRIKATEAQHGLTKAQRRRNLKHSFQCMEDVAGQDFILIDDVMTSGSTFEALSTCLKHAGAGHVHAIAAARATLS